MFGSLYECHRLTPHNIGDKLKICQEFDSRIKVSSGKDLLSEPPIIITVNKFTEESALKFSLDFELAHKTGQRVIPIVIDSFGGGVYSLLSMVDTIMSSKLNVATIVMGKAMSCGSILLSCGKDGMRFASPNSTVMIHEASMMTGGKVEEIKVDTAEVERLNKLIFSLMSRNCGKEETYFSKIVHDKSHADWYLTAEEAKVHNLVNHIRLPEFKVKVNVDFEFDQKTA